MSHDEPDLQVLERWWRAHMLRLYIWLVIITAGFAIGATAGIIGYIHTLHDQRTRALRLSVDNCRRSQDGRRALALIVHTAIPPHRAGRTRQEQAEVDDFYRKVAPALKVPSCS